jgi:hypothetical protein
MIGSVVSHFRIDRMTACGHPGKTVPIDPMTYVFLLGTILVIGRNPLAVVE